MQAYRDNVFEKLPHLEALDGFDKDGNEWSVLDDWDMREDDDYLHDNNLMGEQGYYYTHETLAMRKGSVSEGSDKSQEDDDPEEPERFDRVDEDSSEEQNDSKSSVSSSSKKSEIQSEKDLRSQHSSSISDGDPIKRKRLN